MMKCHEQVRQSWCFKTIRKPWSVPHCRCVWAASWYSVPCLMVPMVIGWSLSTFLPGALGQDFQILHVGIFICLNRRCPVLAWVCYQFLLSSAGTFCEFSNAKWHTRMSQELSKCFVTFLLRWYWWRICKYTLLKADVYIFYMLQGISPSHSHTLPVASDSMKTPPPKRKLHLGPGIHSTIGSKQKVETHLMKSWLFKNRIPISWISTLPICLW